MKLRDKILYMLFGAGLVVLGMVLNSLVSGDAEAQSDGFNMNFGYIACRSLTIVDDNGKVRGRFGLNTYKDAMLIIFGNDGKTVVAYLSGNEVYPTNEMMFRLSSKSKTDKRMVMMTLNDKQIEFYRQVGYLVVPNLLTKTEIGTFLRYEAQQNKQRLGYQTHLVDP